MRIYADYNANCPMRQSAKDAVIDAMNHVGNPSSVHQDGQGFRMRIERARKQLLNVLELNSHEVVFTSGATEAAQLAIESAYAMGFDNVFISSQEHDAVYQYALSKWANVQIIPSLLNGQIDLEWLENALNDAPKSLFIIMAANNETGVIFPVSKISGLVRQNGGAFLMDATQALGKLPAHEYSGFADWLVVSSHKIGGPLGAGALILAPGIDGFRGRVGGGQEKGFRAGTQNTPAIIGFGVALSEINDTENANIANIRDEFEKLLKESFKDVVIIGENEKRLNNTSCFAIAGWPSEYLVIAMDLAGVSISSGSACSSGSVKVSRVIKAIGVDDELAKCVVRVSFGYHSSIEDAHNIVAKMVAHFEIMLSKVA